MTEYCPITDLPNPEYSEYIPGSVGYVSRMTELKVCDLNTGQSLGPDIEGEICVRGPKMFSGYLNNVLATNEAIDSEGWLRTGDIGHYDQNKRLFITDRLKELIKYQNLQISPTEIELFLVSHKCVAEVAVVGVRHQTDGNWLRAYVKLKENMSTTEEELKNFISGLLFLLINQISFYTYFCSSL